MADYTWDLSPEIPVEVERVIRSESTDRSQGFVMRGALWYAGKLDVLRLTYRFLNDAAVSYLRYMWNLTGWGVKTIEYRPPEGSTTEWRFAGPLRITRRNAAWWEAVVEFEEVR